MSKLIRTDPPIVIAIHSLLLPIPLLFRRLFPSHLLLQRFRITFTTLLRCQTIAFFVTSSLFIPLLCSRTIYFSLIPSCLQRHSRYSISIHTSQYATIDLHTNICVICKSYHSVESQCLLLRRYLSDSATTDSLQYDLSLF